MDDFELIVTDSTVEKLKIKHNVTILEVEEAFFNWEGFPLKDNRAKHKTRPPRFGSFLLLLKEGY